MFQLFRCLSLFFYVDVVPTPLCQESTAHCTCDARGANCPFQHQTLFDFIIATCCTCSIERSHCSGSLRTVKIELFWQLWLFCREFDNLPNIHHITLISRLTSLYICLYNRGWWSGKQRWWKIKFSSQPKFHQFHLYPTGMIASNGHGVSVYMRVVVHRGIQNINQWRIAELEHHLHPRSNTSTVDQLFHPCRRCFNRDVTGPSTCDGEWTAAAMREIYSRNLLYARVNTELVFLLICGSASSIVVSKH